jgi:hypothetical protein
MRQAIASGAVSVGRFANGRLGAEDDCAVAVERRLHHCRRLRLEDRVAGRVPAESSALVLCVGDKPGSAAVDTQYCKPVK